MYVNSDLLGNWEVRLDVCVCVYVRNVTFLIFSESGETIWSLVVFVLPEFKRLLRSFRKR